MIRVDGCDLAQWRARSTDMGLTLSEWVRRKCNEANVEVSGTETRRVHEGRVSRRVGATKRTAGRSGELEPGTLAERRGGNLPKSYDTASYAPAESPSTKCTHGKERGELCYKCDPKFGLPSII